MKILIIRLSAIGDTIHCLPVASALKQRIPGARIGWLVEPASAPLLVNNPDIDEVFVLPRQEWASNMVRPGLWGKTLEDFTRFWSNLRNQHYDVALDMQGLLKSAFCGVVSGAPLRVGFAGTREGAERLLTHKHNAGDYFAINRHVVDLNLSMVDYLIKEVLKIPEANQPDKAISFPLPQPGPGIKEKVSGWMNKLVIPDQGMVSRVVLIPGTTWTSKIWSADKWCQLAKLLIEETGRAICLVGGSAEKAVNAEIFQYLAQNCPQSSVIDLTGQTSLVDLIALFEQSHLVIGADTGPLHLAAAVNKPKVAGIYGSSPWLRNGPYGGTSIYKNLWCQPCYAKTCALGTIACLNDLSVEEVWTKVKGLLP